MGQRKNMKASSVECPVCSKDGKQKIIDGFLCYTHGGEKFCKWGQVMNLEDLFHPEENEVVLFMEVKMKKQEVLEAMVMA